MARGEWLGVWFKMYNNLDDVDHTGKYKFWTGKIDNDELGAWTRLLCLASKGNPKGAIQIQGVSLLPHQIDKAIRTDKKYVEKWLKQGALKHENDTVYIENWKLWQSEKDRKDGYILKSPPKSPPYIAPIKSPLTSIELSSNELKKEKELKPIVSGKSADPRVKVLVDYFYDKHLELKGRKVHIDGPKDGNLLKSLLKTFSETELKNKIDMFLTEGDDWTARAGYTIGVFKSQVNKLNKTIDTPVKRWDDAKQTIDGKPIQSTAEYEKRKAEVKGEKK